MRLASSVVAPPISGDSGGRSSLDGRRLPGERQVMARHTDEPDTVSASGAEVVGREGGLEGGRRRRPRHGGGVAASVENWWWGAPAGRAKNL